MVILSATLLAVSTAASDTLPEGAEHGILVKTDAHEGPVYVPSQNRIYFTSKPDFSSDRTHIAIRYVELDTLQVKTWKLRSNMANGMWLSNDGQALIVAEQGTMETQAAISRIRLVDGHREVLVDNFKGKPFNSPNKAIEVPSGWIYFSDPDYGANQGFKPAPKLPMAVYAYDPEAGKTTRLTSEYERPHGLAATTDGQSLYVSDTDAVDGKGPYDPTKTRDIFLSALSAPDAVGPKELVITVPAGIPDGIIVAGPDNDIWVAAGDGLRHYRKDGTLVALYPVEGGVFNVTTDGEAFYSTADTAIWKTVPPPHRVVR